MKYEWLKKQAFYIYALLILVSLLSLAAAVWNFGIDRNYLVEANVPCDPNIQLCFEGDGQDTPAAYKKIKLPAYEIPACNGWLGECKPLSCRVGDTKCTETLCDPSVDTCATTDSATSSSSGTK